MIKHLLSVTQLSREEVTRILDTAESFREVGTRVIKKVPALRGRTVVNLFYENSTRTRISFELAAKRLSADVINFSTGGSSVSKGESLKDTALTLEAMGADAIVIRHSSSGAPHTLSRWVRASVLNAGDGTHEHPTQALLDLFTMREHFPNLEGLQRGDRRRRPALARGPVAHLRAGEDGRPGHAGRPADADPARGAGVGRGRSPTTSTRSCRSWTSATCSASNASGSASSSSPASASTRGGTGCRRRASRPCPSTRWSCTRAR